jgi:SAM-dependent methyltransferase
VLDLGCGPGRHTVALVRLGFDVYACTAAPADVEAARAVVREAVGEAVGEAAAARVTAARPAALGYPDDYFDWVVACGAYDEAAGPDVLAEMVEETRRVMRPGGWVWVALRASVVGAGAAPADLTRLFEAAGFALAERPVEDEADGERLLRGVYRKVDAHTPP